MQINLTLSALTRTHRGISWFDTFANAKPGDQYRIDCANPAEAIMVRQCILKAAKKLGMTSSTTLDGTFVILSINDRQERMRPKFSNHTDIAAAEARHNNVLARIREADEHTTYWLRQISLRQLPEAKALARNAHTAWKMTAARLREEHNSRTLATA